MTGRRASALRRLRFVAPVGLALLPVPAAATPDPAQAVLDAIGRALPPHLAFTYAAGSVDPATGAIVVDGARIAPVRPQPMGGSLTTRRMVLQGARVNPAGDGAFPLVDTMRLEQVVYLPRGDRGVALFETIVLTDVALPPGLIGYLVGDGPAAVADDGPPPDPDAPPSDAQAPSPGDAAEVPADESLSAAEIQALIAGMRVGGITVENLSTREMRGDAALLTATLGTLQIDAIEAGRLAALRLEALRIDDLGVLEIDRIALERLDLGALAGMTLAFRAQAMPQGDAFTLDPGLDSLNVAGVRVHDRDGTEMAALDGLSLDEIDRVEESVTHGRLRLDHLRFPVASLEAPEAERALQAMGYAGVDLSFEVRLARDEQARTLAIAPLALRLADMAALRLEILFGAFDLDELLAQLRQMADSGVPSIPLVTLERLALTVEDQSVAGRLLDHLARETGRGREQLIADTAAEIETTGADAGLPDELRQQAATAVADFLRRPNVLSVSASPAAPVPVVEAVLGVMTSSDETISRLGLRIEAE